jgi:hypothetical protein
MTYIGSADPMAFKIGFLERKNTKNTRKIPAHLPYATLPPSPYLGRDQIHNRYA